MMSRFSAPGSPPAHRMLSAATSTVSRYSLGELQMFAKLGAPCPFDDRGAAECRSCTGSMMPPTLCRPVFSAYQQKNAIEFSESFRFSMGRYFSPLLSYLPDLSNLRSCVEHWI